MIFPPLSISELKKSQLSSLTDAVRFSRDGVRATVYLEGTGSFLGFPFYNTCKLIIRQTVTLKHTHFHPLDSIGIITCTKYHLICNSLKQQLEQELSGQLYQDMGNVNIYDNRLGDVSSLPSGIKT